MIVTGGCLALVQERPQLTRDNRASSTGASREEWEGGALESESGVNI